MVNHSAVPKNSIIHPGDRLALFPKEYVVFADWHDLKILIQNRNSSPLCAKFTAQSNLYPDTVYP